ncbi:MAG TPA: 50S ribosomal protein L6 [Candidatus Omnitrophota bacterium]|nr:50S ribosomal protein L6 [Candidatus Omnitrophota bacterium]
MSRVGRRAIDIPSGVKIEVHGSKVKVESKGKALEHVMPHGFTAEVKDGKLIVARPSDSRPNRALHGTTRSLIHNMVVGLKDGFNKKLEIQGVGYKAQVKGKVLALEIGKSHTVNFPIPDGITIETPSPTEINVKGADKQKVGQTAAGIRGLYPPEPYKGKGIRYVGEYVRRKQGKSIA